MGESFPDPRSIPLYARCADLFDELFPRGRRHTIALAWHVASEPRGDQLHMRCPSILLKRLHGMRSDRQLERFLTERATLKELVSIHWWTLHFLNMLGKAHVDGPAFQQGRRLLGRSPMKLSLVRAALRFWKEDE